MFSPFPSVINRCWFPIIIVLERDLFISHPRLRSYRWRGTATSLQIFYVTYTRLTSCRWQGTAFRMQVLSLIYILFCAAAIAISLEEDEQSRAAVGEISWFHQSRYAAVGVARELNCKVYSHEFLVSFSLSLMGLTVSYRQVNPIWSASSNKDVIWAAVSTILVECIGVCWTWKIVSRSKHVKIKEERKNIKWQ